MTNPTQRGALSDALKQTLITAAVDKITHGQAAAHTPEGQERAAVDADQDPGPDSWTRDDIDTSVACLDEIATALSGINAALQAIMAAAAPKAPPPHRTR